MLAKISRIAVLGFTLIFPESPAFADVQLPTIEDVDDYRVQPDPRSKAAEADRKIRLLNRLLRIALDCRKQGKFEDSLRAYEAAFKLNPVFFRDQPVRAYLYADMNRWSDAKREFDRTISHSVIGAEQARLAAEYCLAHDQPRYAYGFRKFLSTALEEPGATLTLSRVLAAGGQPQAAKEAATRAYYLSCVSGVDPEPARTQLESLTKQPPQLPVANKSNEPEFWSNLDDFIAAEKPPSPIEVRNLLDKSRVVTGYHGKKDSGVQTHFASQSMLGTYRTVSLRPSNDYHLAEIWLAPNLLTCCLNEKDVRDHLNRVKPNVPLTGLNGSEYFDELQAAFDWGTVKFRFSNRGFKPLKEAQLHWNMPGELMPNAKLLLKPTSDETPDWKDIFQSAKVNLSKHRFKECQKQLVFSCNLWYEVSSGNKDPKRREQYEAFKSAFIQLYETWGKPEIADYFRAVALWQFPYELRRMDSGDVDEFPTVQEFRHTMWEVRGGPAEGMYELRARGGALRMAEKGSPLFERLASECGDTGFNTKMIFPVEPKLLDDAEDWFTD
ncbi:hypothetical protein KF728_07185 [Candidatus Obscuribacterales bacterium]|nr:hypothetical protein [Candidatus Obscuribacterales bacterium]